MSPLEKSLEREELRVIAPKEVARLVAIYLQERGVRGLLYFTTGTGVLIRCHAITGKERFVSAKWKNVRRVFVVGVNDV